jgi:AcrR family transcriptional regulator
VIAVLREARKKEMKEQIYLRSIALFKEKGYDHVTIEEVASACGIAKGTFFNYFSKKEHVLLHLGNAQIERMGEIINKYQQVQLKERLQSIFNELLSPYAEHSELLKLTLSETLKSALVMQEESSNIKLFQETLSHIINQAKGGGQFQSQWEPDVIASVLVGIYFNTLISWSFIHTQEESITNLFQKQLDVVWGGIEVSRSR